MDELSQGAGSAGLLSAEPTEPMLREQLRGRAGAALRSAWQSPPQHELTPELEQKIVELVRTGRAERRQRNRSRTRAKAELEASSRVEVTVRDLKQRLPFCARRLEVAFRDIQSGRPSLAPARLH